jgi:hypothetical protein
VGRNRGTYIVRLKEGESIDLDPAYLGDAWRTDSSSTRAPHVTMKGTQLMVQPGASSIKVDGIPVSGDEVPVPVGTMLQLGEFTQLRVDAVIRSTLEVKSAFGNVARTHTDVVVQAKADASKAAALLTRDAQPFALRGEAR